MKLIVSSLFVIYSFTTFAQVNLQTGALNVSIPLINYINQKDKLSFNVSLDYVNGNGIKVTDLASDVGLGWELNATSEIIRIKNGEPDDEIAKDIDEDTHVQEGVINTTDFYGGDPRKLIWNPTYPSGHPDYFDPLVHRDREHDYFSVNLNGHNINFVIGRDKNVLVLNDSKIKINFSEVDMQGQNILTKIFSFEITTDDGIKYLYEAKNLTKILKSTKSATGGGYIQDIISGLSIYYDDITTFTPIETPFFIVDSWLLTKISNPLTGRSITFEYDTKSSVVPKRFSAQSNKSTFYTTSGSNPRSLTTNILQDNVIYNRLKNIIFPDNKKIEFIYSNIPRYDLSGGLKFQTVVGNSSLNTCNRNPLQAVVYKDNENIIYKYQFDQQYFNNTQLLNTVQIDPQANSSNTSLGLISITKIGSDNSSIPVYSFSYNLDSPLPPRFSLFRDPWGYPNEATSTSIFTTPGLDNWQDVPNKDLNAYLRFLAYYEVPATNINTVTSGMLKRIILPTGGWSEFQYDFNKFYSNGSNIPTGGVCVNKIIQAESETANKKVITYSYADPNGNSSAWGYEAPVFSSQSHGLFILPSFNAYKFYQSGFSKFLSTSSSISNLFKNKNTGPLISTGLELISTASSYNIYMLLVQIAIKVGYITQLAYGQYPFNTDINSMNFIENNNLLRPQYARVEEKVSSIIGNEDMGKTVYEFRTATDAPLLKAVSAFPFSNEMRMAQWKYGLPKKISIFDKNSSINPVHTTEYYYADYGNEIQGDNYKSLCFAFPTNLMSPDDPGGQQPQLFSNYSGLVLTQPTDGYNYYYPYKGHTYLTTVSDKIFNTGGNVIETITNYEYNAHNYLVNKTLTTDSKSNTVESDIFYPEDYSIPGSIMETMSTNNIVSAPISTEVWITKPSGEKSLLGTTTNEFGVLPNADIKQIKLYSLESDKPVLQTQIGSFNPSQLIRDANTFKSQGQTNYDINGNAIESIDLKGNRVTSYIYDYSNKYLIAEIKNAYQKDVAYTSFESDGTGGWTIISGSAIESQGAITGKKMFSGTLTKTFLNPGNYTVSLWVKDNSTVTVNGGAGTLINTINSWKLYLWNLSSVSSVTVSGNNFDELRLYPPTAMMKTSTYESSVGKTSECDQNNHIVYYEYDGFARLKLVRDEMGNVVKAYEYNYKQ